MEASNQNWTNFHEQTLYIGDEYPKLEEGHLSDNSDDLYDFAEINSDDDDVDMNEKSIEFFHSSANDGTRYIWSNPFNVSKDTFQFGQKCISCRSYLHSNDFILYSKNGLMIHRDCI